MRQIIRICIVICITIIFIIIANNIVDPIDVPAIDKKLIITNGIETIIKSEIIHGKDVEIEMLSDFKFSLDKAMFAIHIKELYPDMNPNQIKIIDEILSDSEVQQWIKENPETVKAAKETAKARKLGILTNLLYANEEETKIWNRVSRNSLFTYNVGIGEFLGKEYIVINEGTPGYVIISIIIGIVIIEEIISKYFRKLYKPKKSEKY